MSPAPSFPSPRPLLFTHLHLDIRRFLSYRLLRSHEARLLGFRLETNKKTLNLHTNTHRPFLIHRKAKAVSSSPLHNLPSIMAGLHSDGWRLSVCLCNPFEAPGAFQKRAPLGSILGLFFSLSSPPHSSRDDGSTLF